MNILICSDKFKGSLTSAEVCQALADGIHQNHNDINCIIHPIADGGDGTLSILNNHLDTTIINCETIDPLNKAINARYLTHQNKAYFELAEASGIARIAIEDRNPLITNTIGTGLLIKEALSRGFKDIILGLGGSCTNDAGLGIAHALGVKFLDEHNNLIVPNGGNLLNISKIVLPKEHHQIRLSILCDVTNPFFGPNGAAHVFAKQKGASAQDIELLDQGLRHISEVFKAHHLGDISKLEGAGAAGGIGGGLSALFKGEIINGFDFLSKITNLEQAISKADLVITGEGRLDTQSLDGKVIGSISDLCKKHHKKLIGVVGENTLTEQELQKTQLNKVFSLVSLAESKSEAIKNPIPLIREITKIIFN